MVSLSVLDDALVRDWDELAERVGAAPFLRPGWILPWHEAFGAGQLRVAVLRRDDRLVAAMPLCRRGAGLFAPANWHTPLFGPVAEDDYAAAEMVLGLLRDHAARVDLRMLDPVSDDAVRAAAVAASRVVCGRELLQSPAIDLSMGRDAYFQRFSRNRRKELRRVGRRLDEQGEVTFEIRDGREDLDAVLAEVFAVEGSGWKAERGSAIASRPETRAFYTAVARWAAEHGWLRLCLLRVDGRPIAVDLALAHEGTWYALKGGYDAEWGRFGPGIALLCRTLEHAFAEGFERFEMLGSPDTYKLVWANASSERRWVAAFAPSPRGRTAYVWTSARERARPLALRVRPRRAGRGPAEQA